VSCLVRRLFYETTKNDCMGVSFDCMAVPPEIKYTAERSRNQEETGPVNGGVPGEIPDPGIFNRDFEK
jgi:hypothetical protein